MFQLFLFVLLAKPVICSVRHGNHKSRCVDLAVLWLSCRFDVFLCALYNVCADQKNTHMVWCTDDCTSVPPDTCHAKTDCAIFYHRVFVLLEGDTCCDQSYPPSRAISYVLFSFAGNLPLWMCSRIFFIVNLLLSQDVLIRLFSALPAPSLVLSGPDSVAAVKAGAGMRGDECQGRLSAQR